MKKILFLLTLFTLSFSFAQNQTCQTTGFIPLTANFNRAAVPDNGNQTDNEPYAMNTFITLFLEDNGSAAISGLGIIDTPEQIENSVFRRITLLNKQFNQYNIYFKFAGYAVVKNSEAANNSSFTSENTSFFAPYKQPNALNLYFNNLPGNVTSIGGTETMYSLYSLFDEASNNFYAIHEIAHNFSLYHTYEAISHFPDILGNEEIRFATRCERVTRIFNSDFNIYNADIAGDEVTDTAAQPFIFEYNCSQYVFNPANQNCFLEPYENIEKVNFMNASHYSGCTWHFSPGQVARMRNYIATNPDFSFVEGGGDSVRTDIGELYQPFDAQVVPGDIVSVDDQPDNGGAWVCRAQKYRMRFQTGYNQEFSDVGSIPVFNGTVVAQTADQQFNVEVGFGQYVGVKIPSLGNGIKAVGGIESVTPYSCSFEPYVSGIIYSTAILGSMNLTVEQLNEIEVRNPALFADLLAQYYYILKKETASGAQFQKTFYKQ